jgi:hypothetical protein
MGQLIMEDDAHFHGITNQRRRAMTTTAPRRTPVRLSFKDGEVMVTPQDQDIFFISAEKATEACRAAIRQDQRVAKFKEQIVVPLSEWCKRHHEKVLACYLLIPDSSVIPVYMVGTSERYDFELTKELSQLASEFDEHGWSVHVSQIPRCETEQLSGYFVPDHALQIEW